MEINLKLVSDIANYVERGGKTSRGELSKEFNLTDSEARKYSNIINYTNQLNKNDAVIKSLEKSKNIQVSEVNDKLEKLKALYFDDILTNDEFIASCERLIESSTNLPNNKQSSLKPLLSRYVPIDNPDWVYNAQNYNILILPDLHAPFISNKAIDFIVKRVQTIKYDVILCTGDEMDYHASSYHETMAGAMGIDDELEAGKLQLRKLTDAILPYVTYKKIICVDSNHGNMAFRKVHSAGLSSKHLKSKSEVLELPEWEFLPLLKTNLFWLSHGMGSKNLVKRVTTNNISWICGHYHTELYLKFVRDGLWAMQLPYVADHDSYAMVYNKDAREATPPIWGIGDIIRGVPSIVNIAE